MAPTRFNQARHHTHSKLPHKPWPPHLRTIGHSRRPRGAPQGIAATGRMLRNAPTPPQRLESPWVQHAQWQWPPSRRAPCLQRLHLAVSLLADPLTMPSAAARGHAHGATRPWGPASSSKSVAEEPSRASAMIAQSESPQGECTRYFAKVFGKGIGKKGSERAAPSAGSEWHWSLRKGQHADTGTSGSRKTCPRHDLWRHCGPARLSCTTLFRYPPVDRVLLRCPRDANVPHIPSEA